MVKKGFRTIVANVVMALPIMADVAFAVIQTAEFGALVPHEWLPAYTIGIITVNMYLRRITTTPMGRKE